MSSDLFEGTPCPTCEATLVITQVNAASNEIAAGDGKSFQTGAKYSCQGAVAHFWRPLYEYTKGRAYLKESSED